MTPMVKKLLMDKKPIIPQNLKPNVLAWWDARERGQVWYGLNQIIVGGNFPNTTGWSALAGTLSVANQIASITGNGVSNTPSLRKQNLLAYVSGKKIYFDGIVKVTNSDCVRIELEIIVSGMSTISATIKDTPAANTEYPISYVATLGAGGSGNVEIRLLQRYIDAATANGKVMEARTAIAFDLTTDIGSGNEFTATEGKAILAADGNQYWEGTRQVLCNPDFKYYWRDMSGNGRHMKLNNFAYSGGSGWQSPYGLGTDGVDDYGQYAAAEIIPANASMSLVVGFKLPNITGPKYLIAATKQDVSQLSYYGFRLYDANGVLTVYVSNSIGNESSLTAVNTVNTQINKAYIVVITYDQTDKKARLYINGLLVAITGALSNGICIIENIKIGINVLNAAYSAQTEYMAGVFNKTLTPSEVKQLYDNNKRRFGL